MHSSAWSTPAWRRKAKTMGAAATGSSTFQRLILPGLAFKAAVIGGGYATGRELAEYFIPSGPQIAPAMTASRRPVRCRTTGSTTIAPITL